MLVLLLAIGAWQLARNPATHAFRTLLCATIAGQLLLHLLIGRETFLYSMHFAPLLIAAAACGTLGRQRALVLAMTAGLIVSAGVNNWQQFARSTAIVGAIARDAAEQGAVFQPADACR